MVFGSNTIEIAELEDEVADEKVTWNLEVG